MIIYHIPPIKEPETATYLIVIYHGRIRNNSPTQQIQEIQGEIYQT